MASANSAPIQAIGNWYQSPIENLYFEIVAVDASSGSIEIQYVDGEVSEIDQDSWEDMALSPASPPEDAGAAFEMPREDNWNSDAALNPDNWNNPLNQIEPDLFQGFDDF